MGLSRRREQTRQTRTIPTTRVSVVAVTPDNQILLVRHRKGSRQYWVLPGGRLEYGETFQECAVREVKEETGLDVDPGAIVFLSEAIAPDRSRHILNVFLTARITGGSLRLGAEPVLAGVDFLPLAQLETVTLYPPVSRQIIDAAAAGFVRGISYLGNLWV